MPGEASFLAGSDRDKILQATADLSAEIGYEELGTEAIAARAGLPVEAVDRQFPGGRDECLAAAHEAILLEVVAAVARSYSPDRPEWESVPLGVEEILELMAENPGFAYLGYVFSRQMARGRLQDLNLSGHRMLEAMLERGWEYSRTSEQPACTALGVLGAGEALVRRELAAGRPERLPRLLPDCIYIATVPFLGQAEALRIARLSERLVEERKR